MMLQNRDLQILEKIRNYCGEIQFTHSEYGHDYGVFCNNPTYRNAIALCLLQIGELVKKLSDEFLSEHTTIPWRAIRGMRNIVAHEYAHIDLETIWETSDADIVALQNFCEQQIQFGESHKHSSDLTML